MKTLLAIAIITAGLNIAWPQELAATKEIERTLRDYLSSMSTRDVQGLRAVLDKRFVAVEAGREKAGTQVVDTGNPKEMLPPEGNDDWQPNRMKLSSVKAEISATHPSVAMASFILTQPLSEKRIADFQTALKDQPDRFDEVERKALAKLIADHAVKNAMFAMLARADGKWKIVAMSFPK